MTNKNYLTTEAYVEMAEEITNVLEDLRIIRTTLEFIQHPKDVARSSDMTVEYYKVYQYTDSLFPKMQGLIKNLEHIGDTLYSVDELEELEEFVRAEWILPNEKDGVTVSELAHYQKQGYTVDEALKILSKKVPHVEMMHDDDFYKKYGSTPRTRFKNFPRK